MKVETFDSVEELFDAMQRNQRAADTRIQDWQRKVRPGDKVIRVANFGEPVLVYGEVIDPIEIERKCYNLDDPEEAEEFAAVKDLYGKEWQQSYRFGRFYSPFCPEGELGDIHLMTITGVLTETEFEEARKQNWPQDFWFARTVHERRQHGN